MQLHGIGSALHEVELVFFGGLPDGDVDTEDAVFFMIDVALDRVQVFCHFLVFTHVAGGKTGYPPVAVADGYHDTVTVEVVQPAFFTLLQQANLRHQLDGQAGCLGKAQQIVPTVGRISDAHLFGVCLSPPAFDIVGGHLVLRIEQVLAKMFGTSLVDDVHAFALHTLLFLLGRQLRFFDLNAVSLAQGADGLGEGQRVVLHQEADDVTTLAASEAMPRAAGRVHHETGCLLLMQWAAGCVVRAFLFQLDVTADDIDDVGTVEDLFDNSFVNHSLYMLCAGLILHYCRVITVACSSK